MPARPCRAKESSIRFISRLCLGIYLVEAGLLLVVAPWTAWWGRNYFALLHPWLFRVMATGLARTLVVAAGIITVVAGITELRIALARRLAGPPSSDRPPDA